MSVDNWLSMALDAGPPDETDVDDWVANMACNRLSETMRTLLLAQVSVKLHVKHQLF